jgi:1,4-alpha-glucan branching enzyme
MWAHPGKQLLFMGSEFGQQSEWNQELGLEWSILDQAPHHALQNLVKELNRNYLENAAMWEQDHVPAGFQWVDGGNSGQNVLTFIRYDSKGNPVACVINFAGTPHFDFRLGLPIKGTWNEILNTDSEDFGGSGVGNLGKVETSGEGSHGQPFAATIQVPPLGAVWFRPAKASKAK